MDYTKIIDFCSGGVDIPSDLQVLLKVREILSPWLWTPPTPITITHNYYAPVAPDQTPAE